jgi:hypothetical protein
VISGCRFEPRPAAGADAAPGSEAPVDDAAPPDTFVAPACATDASYTPSPAGRRYRVVTESIDYDTAIDRCTADGAHLVVLDDATEHAYVRTLTEGEYWIGLDDLTRENQFTWVTGAPFAFSGFVGDEPNDNGVEDCTYVRSDATWNDTSCADTRPAVCECDPGFDAAVTPACRTAAGSTTINGRRYFIETSTALDWNAAAAACIALGDAHLVVIGDLDENTAIDAELDVDAWIGYSDQLTEGTFAWVNNAPAGFEHFGTPPTGDTEDCVVLDFPDGTWNDTECGGAKPYVCECDPAPP